MLLMSQETDHFEPVLDSRETLTIPKIKGHGQIPRGIDHKVNYWCYYPYTTLQV